MSIKVVFFGMIAEKLNKDSDLVDFTSFEGMEGRSDEVFRKIYPELEGLTFQVAVDHSLNADVTKETSEIALLPPFAGG